MIHDTFPEAGGAIVVVVVPGLGNCRLVGQSTALWPALPAVLKILRGALYPSVAMVESFLLM